MAEIQYFYPAASKATKKSIGLVFEPNLFTLYYYADTQGEQPLAYQSFEGREMENIGEVKNLIPLFALEFNEHHTLVPYGMFDESDFDTLLKFTTSFGGTKAKKDRILGYETILVSSVNESTEKLVKENFPGLKVKHLLSSLLELGRTVLAGDKIALIIYRSGSLLSLSILNHDELLFSNSVESNHLEDMYYFIHYTAKQLGLNKDHHVYLLGSKPDIDPLQEHLSSFFHNIHLGFRNTKAHLHDADAAAHWLGIHASQCAL